jgi:PAS domain S-box-containing protein
MFEKWFLTDITVAQKAMPYSYDLRLVAGSLAIAIFASLTAFILLDRYRSANSPASRAVWLATGSVAMGSGIWAMHFVAMLAIEMGTKHHYDVMLTVLSVVVAMGGSALGLQIATKANREKWYLFPAGGAALGAAIGGMHYMGMSALHGDTNILYDPQMFLASVLVAVVLSTLTLWLLNQHDSHRTTVLRYPFGAATLMGLSVTAMHYCGMAATYIIPTASTLGHAEPGMGRAEIAMAVAGGTFLIIQAAMVAAMVDHHMRVQSNRIQDSEGLLNAIFRSTLDGIIAINDRGIILTYNDAAERIFGYGADEAIGNNVKMLMDSAMGEHHDVYVSNADIHGPKIINEKRQLFARTKSGALIPIELTVTNISLDGQAVYMGVCRDETQRTRMESGIRLLQRIAMASNEANAPKEALRTAVNDICLYTGWSFGHVYLYDEVARNLAPSGIWYPDIPNEFREFKELTMRTNIEPGVGLPGRAFANKELEWVRDVAGKMAEIPDFIKINRYPRAMAAIYSGLSSAFAFPISVGDKVVAVLEFFSAEVLDKDPQLLDLVSNIVAQLGRVFEREQAERQLILQQQFVQSITTNLVECILVIDRYGIIEFSNPAAQRMLACQELASLDGARADHIFQLTDGTITIAFADSVFCQAIKNREIHVADYAKFILPDDRVLTVAFACAPARSRSGEPSAVISFRDTRELRKAQTDALQASKLASVGELAAGIAHEINSPIQFIGDNIGFIRETNEDIETVLDAYATLANAVRATGRQQDEVAALDEALEAVDLAEALEDSRDATEQSLRGVERIARIIQAMKEFSHPGSKDMDEVDLNHAIESTTVVCRNEWKSLAELEMDLQEDLPPVYCFAGELNQVFLNMIVNAAHAIRSKGDRELGQIRILTRQVEDEVEIRIADSGSGIPPEIRDKIFDPFFTTKEVGKGTGQGLAISHDVVVNKHGGRIDVESEVGQGTTFIVRIPIDCRIAATEAA